jgi:hypothetical protein
MNSSTTGKSRAAPASAPILVGLLWCNPVSLVLRLFALSGDPLAFDLEQGKPACALQLNSIVSRRICLLRYLFHSLPMVRKRGRPRRGAAWDARKAQRRRREQLERASALAIYIIRKKAKEEKRALLATIVEPRPGCSRDKQNDGLEGIFPPCIVEEDPTLEDLTLVVRNEATPQEKCTSTPVQDDYIPGCLVEEIPWPGDDNVSSHDSQGKEDGEVGAIMAEEQREGEVGGEAATGTVDSSGSVHGPLLREEHLALVFDLRGHLSDLELRVCTMGRSMDMLLDAFSNAPAKRKCPLCAQAFALPAGFMWQKDEDGRPPGT